MNSSKTESETPSIYLYLKQENLYSNRIIQNFFNSMVSYYVYEKSLVFFLLMMHI